MAVTAHCGPLFFSFFRISRRMPKYNDVFKGNAGLDSQLIQWQHTILSKLDIPDD
jgi:hypothetical protein